MSKDRRAAVFLGKPVGINRTYELNGVPREATVVDKSVQPKTKSRAKADPDDPKQIGAPIPGMVSW